VESPAPQAFPVEIDGHPEWVTPGESIAGVLLQLDLRRFRVTARRQQPRGYFCGMGVCFDCLVEADGALVQACQTLARSGMRIDTAHNLQTEVALRDVAP
jgi:predicted molibdopterin-dependent oxidoreductase YjgC